MADKLYEDMTRDERHEANEIIDFFRYNSNITEYADAYFWNHFIAQLI